MTGEILVFAGWLQASSAACSPRRSTSSAACSRLACGRQAGNPDLIRVSFIAWDCGANLSADTRSRQNNTARLSPASHPPRNRLLASLFARASLRGPQTGSWIPRHAGRVRESGHSGIRGAGTSRKPLLLLRFDGVFLLKTALQRRVFRNNPRERIKDLLPGKASACGMTARDKRLFLKAGYTVDISPSLANNSERGICLLTGVDKWSVQAYLRVIKVRPSGCPGQWLCPNL